MFELELEDMVQEAVLYALEAGESRIIISGDVQSFREVVGYMGYQCREQGDSIIISW